MANSKPEVCTLTYQRNTPLLPDENREYNKPFAIKPNTFLGGNFSARLKSLIRNFRLSFSFFSNQL